MMHHGVFFVFCVEILEVKAQLWKDWLKLFAVWHSIKQPYILDKYKQGRETSPFSVGKIDRNVYMEACFSLDAFELISYCLLWDGIVAKQNR